MILLWLLSILNELNPLLSKRCCFQEIKKNYIEISIEKERQLPPALPYVNILAYKVLFFLELWWFVDKPC